MSMLKYAALGAFGAFVVTGPLQHVGALPQTAFGDASKAAIKLALNLGTTKAFAGCGNNGFGNGGGDPAPGFSGLNGAPDAGQKLEDVVR